jgi:hypothetical protein
MASTKSTKPPKKKVKLLKPEQIPEVILDTDNDESEDDSNETADGEEDYEFDESDQLLQHKQAPSQSSYKGGSSAATATETPHSPSPHDVSEDEEEEKKPDQQTVQQEASSWWTLTSRPGKSRVHNYTGGPRGKKSNEVLHINDSSSPLSIFLLFFTEVITLLVAETNQYYHRYLDTLDNGPSPEPDVTEHEMYLFLAITIQMGHCIRDQLLGHIGPVLHAFLQQLDKMRHMPTHPSLLTLYRQQKLN